MLDAGRDFVSFSPDYRNGILSTFPAHDESHGRREPAAVLPHMADSQEPPVSERHVAPQQVKRIRADTIGVVVNRTVENVLLVTWEGLYFRRTEDNQSKRSRISAQCLTTHERAP